MPGLPMGPEMSSVKVMRPKFMVEVFEVEWLVKARVKMLTVKSVRTNVEMFVSEMSRRMITMISEMPIGDIGKSCRGIELVRLGGGYFH